MKKTQTRRRTFWVPDELWAKLEAASKEQYLTVSALIRQFIVAGLKRGKK